MTPGVYRSASATLLAPCWFIWSRVITLMTCGVSSSDVSVLVPARLRVATMPSTAPRAVSWRPLTVTGCRVVTPGAGAACTSHVPLPCCAARRPCSPKTRDMAS
ncbi:hypothetical protein D3C71_1340730 [compost metagenome]